MILEIDAQRRLLAEDHKASPRILVSGLFAGRGSSGLALSFACRGSPRLVLKGLLADDSRLALDVFCWPRILEVVAARRLLVEDPGSWR